MADSTHKQPEIGSEKYSFTDSETASQVFATRTAETQAAFFLPHLKPGMDLLDCGCGPGTITAGFATAVAPGQVVGVDVDAGQVEQTERYISERSIANVRIETASVYDLPFSGNSFDAVFSHAVLDHLQAPLLALKEMHRVLKPGGTVGVCTVDQDGHLLAPADPVLVRCWQLFAKLKELNGGNMYMGKEQRALLRQAGFVRV